MQKALRYKPKHKNLLNMQIRLILECIEDAEYNVEDWWDEMDTLAEHSQIYNMLRFL